MNYRPNVAAIIQDSTGKILIGERVDVDGAWQFPQGGVAKGETRKQALARELLEEVCLPPEAYEIVSKRGPYRYGFRNGRRKRGYDGQKQTYFLVRLLVARSAVDVHTAKPEFRRVRWIAVRSFDLNWVPDFKRGVYARVLEDFFGGAGRTER